MQFTNRPNQKIIHEGSEYWISRAMAVVALVVAETPGQRYILLDKRGKGTPDYQGYWNMPCGYLDWDETGTDAAVREIFEETGFLIPDQLRSQMHQPWFVDTGYGEYNRERQNVSMRYFVKLTLDDDSRLPVLSTAYCEPDEVDEAGWFTIAQALEKPLAFNHAAILREFFHANGWYRDN